MSASDVQSHAASVLRLGRGLFAARNTRQPKQTLELYDHEACPYCRKVRDVLTELDLEYIERSCPKGDRTKRPFVRSKGREQFPFLVDPNTGDEMFESEDIITHLMRTYAGGRSLPARLASPLNTMSSAFASMVRPRGSRIFAGSEDRVQPEKLLSLWNFEASPYCRKVREVLCALNLDYHVLNVGKNSPRRPQLIALGGKMQVPYLVDPNTNTAMYESEDIIDYLQRTYG